MEQAWPPLKEVIARFGLQAKKSLGQHFLLDERVTDRIVAEAGIPAGANVIEVGPGPGGLTRSLLRSGAGRVIAIEKDSRCIEALSELQAADARLEIMPQDALKMDWAAIESPKQVVANLPYNVGTLLLLQWLEMIGRDASSFTRLTLMFQREVAERIAAEAGSKEYGRLSVLSQFLCEVVWHFDLPPGAFSPPPKVHSSVISLIPRAKPLYDVPVAVLEKVTAAAFNQRRKMLRGSLKALGADTEALLDKAGIDGQRRAETLSIEEFYRLADAYLSYT